MERDKGVPMTARDLSFKPRPECHELYISDEENLKESPPKKEKSSYKKQYLSTTKQKLKLDGTQSSKDITKLKSVLTSSIKKGSHKKTLSRSSSHKSKMVKGVKVPRLPKEELNVQNEGDPQVQPINTLETNGHQRVLRGSQINEIKSMIVVNQSMPETLLPTGLNSFRNELPLLQSPSIEVQPN